MSFVSAIFPGQGAQLVGMGKDFCGAFPVAADLFRRADEVLGFELSHMCFEGPAEVLNATDIQQPAIFVTSVAAFRAVEASGLASPSRFSAMGGLSLGEYTALHLAGSLDFEDALRLVYRRGQLMQEAARASAGGMVSIMGLDEPAVVALCDKARSAGRIGPANFNCPGQIVISGDKAACDEAARIVDEFGGKAVPLPVAGAFHSELMKPAADGLRPVLAAARFKRPAVRVIANVDASDHAEPDAIRESLYRQVFSPVRWQSCCEKLIQGGCLEFWEFGPNRVLMGLMRKINKSAKVHNISKASDLAAPTAAGGGA